MVLRKYNARAWPIRIWKNSSSSSLFPMRSGAAKPSSDFFDVAYRRMEGVAKDRVLVIGDNPNADVGGALAYGFDACWLRHPGIPDRRKLGETHPHPKYKGSSADPRSRTGMTKAEESGGYSPNPGGIISYRTRTPRSQRPVHVAGGRLTKCPVYRCGASTKLLPPCGSWRTSHR